MMDRMNRSMSPTAQSHALGSFSQLGVFHNHGGVNSNAHLGLIPTAAEEIIKLKKEVRATFIFYHLNFIFIYIYIPIASFEVSRV